jgi:hypothetical protein
MKISKELQEASKSFKKRTSVLQRDNITYFVEKNVYNKLKFMEIKL